MTICRSILEAKSFICGYSFSKVGQPAGPIAARSIRGLISLSEIAGFETISLLGRDRRTLDGHTEIYLSTDCVLAVAHGRLTQEPSGLQNQPRSLSKDGEPNLQGVFVRHVARG
jgi:hypothetical protein